MIAVHSQTLNLPRDDISFNEMSTIEPQKASGKPKQSTRKSICSSFTILCSLVAGFLLIIAGFIIYKQFIVQPTKTEINLLHGNIVQSAESSSKDKSTNQGSTSTRSSRTNDKPNQSSRPASKSTITSSNIGEALSTSGSGDDKDGGDDEDFNDEKKKNIFKKNKASDTKFSKRGSSTDDDSQSVQSESENTVANDDFILSSERLDPLIGSKRP